VIPAKVIEIESWFAANAHSRFLADIVAKVPNCPAPTFLL
jgi:hypothetical protein